MKNIIKHGRKPEPICTIKRFQCTACDCIFECDEGEYMSEKHPGGKSFSSCPECEKSANEVVMR